MAALRVEGTVALASSPRELWPLLVDTDRTNRALGLAAVEYAPVAPTRAASGARVTGQTSLGGFRVRYEELPYEWEHERRFGVRRVFEGGPLEVLDLRWTLEPSGEGCSLRVAAFRFVDDHFDVLRAAVAETGGAVVKTMGDAVMAAYTDDAACLRGAIACLERFEAFRRATPHAARTSLKVGLHAGPAYVVTANGALDYFGQTVNVASRLQHVAASGELVFCDGLLSLLTGDERARLELQAADVRVKGVAETLHVVRARRKGSDADDAPSVELRPREP